jgi:general secretion pathway protein C
LLGDGSMMKAILDRHEWAVDLATAVLCASALAHATSAALDRRPTPAPPAMVIAAQAPADRYWIRSVGEHAYEIEGTSRQLVADMTLMNRTVRVVPELRDGRPVGFRLYSVPPDGPLARLGFRDGDVVRRINGLDLTTPEKALEIYARLKSARGFAVAFERNGQPLTNEYWLRH